jgi:hypothetical protein
MDFLALPLTGAIMMALAQIIEILRDWASLPMRQMEARLSQPAQEPARVQPGDAAVHYDAAA